MDTSTASYIITCAHCGAVIEGEALRTHDGQLICEDCYDRFYFTCHDCEEIHPQYEAVTINPGCYDEYVVCSDCHDDGVDNGEYCQCDGCGDVFDDNRISMHGNGRHNDIYHICNYCEDNYVTCDSCGDIIHIDDADWDEDNDVYYCTYCHDANVIHSYSYKPNPIFGTTDARTDGFGNYSGTELTFGVELECDKGNDDPNTAARDVQKLTDRLYIKHDGSLNFGYEIVTHPGTLAWHMNSFPWAAVCKASLDHGFQSHNAKTCGLHIHIGNRQFGRTWAERRAVSAKIAVLTDVLWPEIEQFSRRGRGGCERWAARNDCLRAIRYEMDEGRACEALFDRASCDRYKAVNLTNSNTVELRFNRGSLKVDTILASLQLASNLAKFAMSHTVNECIDAKWDDILNVDIYEELSNYVIERFADFTPEESDRVRATVRVGDARPEPTTREGVGGVSDFFRWEYVASYDDDVHACEEDVHAGDIVRCDNIPGNVHDLTDAVAVEGCVGVHLRNNSAGNVWGTGVNGRALHRNCDHSIQRGQWNVSSRYLSRATSLRNGERIDRDSVLEAVRLNYLPGDRVRILDNTPSGYDFNPELDGVTGTIVSFFGHGEYLAANVRWDKPGVGHTESGLVDDLSIWNVRLSNLVRV